MGWEPSQAAVDEFQNARRDEEPEEFAERMNHEIRIESDHENRESEADLEEKDKMAAETEDEVPAGRRGE